MKILFITYRLPNPKTIDGYSIRILNIAKILNKNHKVDLVSVYQEDENLKYKNGLEKKFRNIFLFKKNRFSKFIGGVKGIFSRDPIQENIYYSSEMKKWIDDHYKNYDLIFCNTLRTTKYAFNLRTKKVIDFIEDLGLKYSEAINFVNFFWRIIYKIEVPRIQKLEKKILNNFDKIFISSEFDKNYLISNIQCPISNLVVIPNGIKDNLIKLQISNIQHQEEDIISFFGRMTYQPNEDAVIFFAKNVFPKIKKQIPKVKFFIIGGPVSFKVKKLKNIPGVIVTGFLNNPYEIILKSKVFICPLRFGAGILNKVLEAMVLGKAVITTPIGIRAIKECVDDKNVIIIDDLKPEEITNRVLQILKDDRKRQILGQNAQKLILENYRWDKIGEKLLDTIKELN
ncbi:MAG: glycosyltransferase family 4 protein [Candidatus Pacebacteria bacterium]|nr:glycosyltransferase family 4 protein [Candidatus Paceibacterota bacterium]